MSKKRTTIRDVARLAQVAPITVSRVVNNSGYISPETRQRVESAVLELNYVPNMLAHSLRHQKTNMVALLISDITNPFWTTAARGVEDRCNGHNVNVILCNTDEQEDKLTNYVNLLMQRQIDGFILVPTGHHEGVFDKVRLNNIPLILLDRTMPDMPNVPVVRSDSETGGYLLTEHLIRLGHRRIAMLSANDYLSTSEQRTNGYRRALAVHGLPVEDTLIRFGNYTQQSGCDMTLDLMATVSPRPTAIVTANNFIAFGAQRGLEALGLRVPADVSLATFDELPRYMYPTPFLTTILQDPYRMGQEAARLLVERLENPDAPPASDVVLPVELIARASTIAPS